MPQPQNVVSPLDRVDLHMHTRSSDGGWTPEQLVDHLVKHDFRVVALCDHDTMRSVPEFMERAQEKGLTVLPGVEFTTWWNNRQWHLLVYGIDPGQLPSTEFGSLLAAQQANLREHAERAASLLEQHGHKLPSLDEVVDGRQLIPTYVLQTAIKDGHATNLMTAHQLTIKLGEDLRVDTPLEQVVDAAHKAGGTCVIAHPGRNDGAGIMSADQLERMVATIPIDGLEGHYRSYTTYDTVKYRDLAHEHGLLVTSGSDSHAPGVPVFPRAHLARWVAPFLDRMGLAVEPFEGEPWVQGAMPEETKEPEKAAQTAEAAGS